jgi:hypothetical protein
MQGQLKASRCKNIKPRTTREEHKKRKQHKSKYTRNHKYASTNEYRVMETMTEASSAIQAEVTKALAESTSTSTSSLLPGAACLELVVQLPAASGAGAKTNRMVYPQSLTLKNPKKATQLPPSCHSGAPLGF